MNKIEEYKRVAMEFPLPLTLTRIKLKIKERLHQSTKDVMIKKDEQILNILDKEFQSLLPQMDNNQLTRGNKIIWVMWLQGFEHAPKIVKICRQFLEKNKPEQCTIIDLTAETLPQYVHFSDDIIKKIKDGTITYTHLSDLVRAQVLSKHGGLWIDSTVLVTNKMPNNLFEYPWFTIKGYPGQGVSFVKQRWTGFLMGGGRS